MPELDGLRAIAVLMVITCHLHVRVWDWLWGQRGVTVFFVISGYLITSLALAEEAKRGRLSLAGFYIRRSFRIFPLYYFVLGGYTALIFGTGLWPKKAGVLSAEMPYLLLYLQEYPHYVWQSIETPFYHSWSLGIEEKLYLIWPALCFLVLSSRRAWRSATAITMIVALSLMGKFTLPYASIMIGCLLALVLQPSGVRRWIATHATWSVWAALASVLAMQAFAPWFEVGYALAVAAFLGILVYSGSPLRTALGCRPLAYVGKVSYGVYLVHILCINAVERIVHQPVLTYVAAVALSVAAASVLHLVLERPLIAVGRRLANRYIERSTGPRGAELAIA